MGPRDRSCPLPDGASCTACGAFVPTRRIDVLASREGLSFVRIACADCGSAAIGLLMDGDGGLEPILDVAADGPRGRPVPRSAVAAITHADVDAVRRDLAAWGGDLVGWLGR